MILAFFARPVVVAILLVPARLRRGERLFVMWGGLKGAVPILLAAFAVIAGAHESARIYGIVFVVVLFSVVVQGTSIPFAAGRLGVPMRMAEPRGRTRLQVRRGSHADGRAVRDLPLAERTWVDGVRRDGVEVPVHGSTVLRPDDEVTLITDLDDLEVLRRVFGEPG